MIVDDLVNHHNQIGSVEIHEVVHCEGLLHITLLYKDYFLDNPTFKSKTFRWRFACFLYFLSNLHVTSLYYC
jgi:hypothetical protein